MRLTHDSLYCLRESRLLTDGSESGSESGGNVLFLRGQLDKRSKAKSSLLRLGCNPKPLHNQTLTG